jgi:DNA-nicking Smr family endonuclease
MTAGKGKNEDDVRLWERIAREIAPLPAKTRRKPTKVAKAEAVRPAPQKPTKTAKPAVLPKPIKPALPVLSGVHAPGLDARSFDKLKRGQRPIDARLDLHGLTLMAAHRALIRFIEDGAAGDLRTLLVITGKGGRRNEDGMPRSSLRDSVPRWLNEPGLRKHLLAFSQAQAKHGGAGALYALLKRKR